MINKGIILAGGAGTRLYPLTLVASKQLQPVFDKPMIYYPLTTLMLGGIRRICLVSTPQDVPRFEQLLGNGEQWGIEIEYAVQPKPEGIAQAFLVARDFIGDDKVALILGDNLFHGRLDFTRIFGGFDAGATIFAYRVRDPERYGVVDFDTQGRAVSLEEKPKQPRSHYAIPGLYLYDEKVVELTENLKPSARGELEITDLNLTYMKRGALNVEVMGRGMAWLDTGTSTSLHEASSFIAIVESRQGTKIGCPEEVALRMGFIKIDEFERRLRQIPGQSEYGIYLTELAREFREGKR